MDASQSMIIRVTDRNDSAPIITSFGGEYAEIIYLENNQEIITTITSIDPDLNSLLLDFNLEQPISYYIEMPMMEN